MRVPSEADLLGLWESGQGRHPIDRDLLLCAWARPDLPPDTLADLPLGAVNTALLRLRMALFGTHLSAVVDCEHCGDRLEFSLDLPTLLASASDDDVRAELDIGPMRFRVPTPRDLAAVVGLDAARGATALLERCRTHGRGALAEHADDVDSQIEALDPAAEFGLAVACQSCGHKWSAPLDVGAVLWSEVAARAEALFADVDALARAYGWTEPEVLTLSSARRAAYVARATA